MTQAVGSVTFNTFVKGLITDSSNLNSDPNTIKSGTNFVLNKEGTLNKRLGLSKEFLYDSNLSGITKALRTNTMTTFNGRKFLVVLKDTRLIVKPEAGGTELLNIPVTTTAGVTFNDRFLIISGSGWTSVLLYEYGGSVFSYKGVVDVEVRDFDGVNDGLLANERPVALSDFHKYNLENQGWGNTFPYSTTYLDQDCTYYDGQESCTSVLRTRIVSGAPDYEAFKNQVGKYPSNSDIGYIGIWQDPEDDGRKKFRAEDIVKTYIGNAYSPRGSKLLKCSSLSPRKFIDDTLVAGQPIYPFGDSTTKVSSCFFGGRIFYGAQNYVLFSQILGQDSSKFGKCYQDADPTSEEISDLLDTDGGLIKISGAANIFAVKELGSMLLVFAQNGVWSVSGGEATFKATEYSIRKVSSFTAVSEDTIQNIPTGITFVSKDGIMVAAQDDVTLGAKIQSLTFSTIQSLYNTYDFNALLNCRIEYSTKEAKIYYLFGSDVLVLDLSLKAWYKLTLRPGCVGLYYQDEERVITVDSTIVHLGVDVVHLGEEVTLSQDSVTSVVPQIRFLYSLVGGVYSCSMGCTSYKDFCNTAEQYEYTASLVTYPIAFDNFSTAKRVPQLTAYFTKTEIGYTENEEGGLEYVNPSSCSFKVGWDMPTVGSNLTDVRNAWSREYQLYRLSRYEAKSLGDVPAQALESLSTRTSVRGRGRTASFRFESPSGFDCRLLGWTVDLLTNTRNK